MLELDGARERSRSRVRPSARSSSCLDNLLSNACSVCCGSPCRCGRWADRGRRRRGGPRHGRSGSRPTRSPSSFRRSLPLVVGDVAPDPGDGPRPRDREGDRRCARRLDRRRELRSTGRPFTIRLTARACRGGAPDSRMPRDRARRDVGSRAVRVLALDVGTSSVRAQVFGPAAAERKPARVDYAGETDPDRLVRATQKAIRDCRPGRSTRAAPPASATASLRSAATASR